MKKRIIFLLATALIALSMIMPGFADEISTEPEDEAVTELVTEVTTEPTEAVTEPDAVEPYEDATEVVTEPAEGADELVVDATDDEWETFKSRITDSATWTMIGTAIVTILTTIGTVKSKFDKITSLVHNKADNETLKGALKDVENDLKEVYNANHKEITEAMKRYEEALKNSEANEQRLYAILTLFMTNCKISESAKAEILSLLANVKSYAGNLSEFVEQAQESINKKIAEETEAETPYLDKLLAEDYMELG